LEAENPTTRSNDARVHPSGSFWISTMGWQAEQGAGGIFLYRDGKIEQLMDNLSVPNAICFSNDGTSAYFTDSAVGHIMEVAVNPENGYPVGEAKILIAREKLGLPADAAPDGAITDANGNIWIAVFGGSKIVGFSPKAERIGEMALPAVNVTCPTFIGNGAHQMLITTARFGLSPQACADNPQEGATFITKLDFTGRFDARVAA